ncbi:hypothetical protein SGGMMB4_00928 [Sodalis glossinidius str. 'morsitans']|uniref:Uncharacterized protein n=1 Tax=Sodalis glossinidius (strain morsitans) TaxID=343509 RepID=A0A193QGK8_SODGM|nr:hypothetical protein [Sodalis glossinidius]CRL44050.1 hypothetical protein SGGMMB4_00928 [Sodalis glossinidius str. 'morsitans']
MLQANIIMDNADYIAQFIVDIGQGRPYTRNDNSTLRRIEELMATICCRCLRKSSPAVYSQKDSRPADTWRGQAKYG